MENFTMKDIHSGYVIELRNGHRLLAARVNQNNYTKIFIYDHITNWFYASAWDEETLKFKFQSTRKDVEDFDIVKVYSLISVSRNYADANSVDISRRRLLWERKEPKIIKMSQIRKLVGALGNEELIIEVDDNV